MTESKGLIEWCRLQWDGSEKARFLVVGVYNTLFGYVVFAGLYLLLGHRVHYLVVMVIAHILAVCNAFVGHRILTFRVKDHLLRDFLRFNLSYTGVLVFGIFALPAMVEGLHAHPLSAQAVVIALTTLGSYILHKRISFHRS